MERLYRIAEAEEINIVYRRFAQKIHGIYCCLPGQKPIIGLSLALSGNYRLHRCVLSEELGHHFTSTGDQAIKRHYCIQDRLSIDKIEYKALRWAANFLVPENDLLDAIASGLCEIWELAEEFDVSEEMMRFRMRLFGVRTE